MKKIIFNATIAIFSLTLGVNSAVAQQQREIKVSGTIISVLEVQPTSVAGQNLRTYLILARNGSPEPFMGEQLRTYLSLPRNGSPEPFMRELQAGKYFEGSGIVLEDGAIQIDYINGRRLAK